MFIRKLLNFMISFMVVNSMLFGAGSQALAKTSQPTSGSTAPNTGQTAMVPNDEIGTNNGMGQMRTMTMAMRNAAAANQKQRQQAVTTRFAGINPATASLSPLGTVASGITPKTGTGATAVMDPPNSAPDYFGLPNWANSQLPELDPTTGAVLPNTGIRKFIDTLPGLCGLSPWGTSGANSLGQCIPLATPDKNTFPGNTALNANVKPADYYEIAVVEYHEQMSPDLPATGTKLRGYVQLYPLGTLVANAPTAVPLTAAAAGVTADIMDPTIPPPGQARLAYAKPQYLGPMILTQRDRPVRVKFTNYLPTGPAGELFLPVDTTYMGAGMGPNQSIDAINVLTPGAGYTSAPTVVLSASQTGGRQAAATANINNGSVISFTVTDGGSGYTAAPTVTLTGGGFTTLATASAVLTSPIVDEMYKENRATLHLHGGNTPWISDGTPHQWTTPQGEVTAYQKGISAAYVPDMWFDANGALVPSCSESTTCAVAGASNDPGLGSLTFYWTNQQSGRLLFYHDHAYGITRLNVYAGEAAGYLITDPVEETALAAATVPGTINTDANGNITTADLNHLIPLVIEDKTFVPKGPTASNPTGLGTQLAATDPTWDVVAYGGQGNLWLPHIWIPNQNPADVTGANAFGRWDYGPWFWPPQDPSTFVAGGLPKPCSSAFYGGGQPAFPPLMCPGIPTPSGAMEAMMDTATVNGAAYPTLTVDPTAYRLQMLMAGNDRAWNLGLYVADPLSVAVTYGGAGYTVAPAVTITPAATDTTGGGAVATAIISGGSISGFTINNVGAGYDPAVPVIVAVSAPVAAGGVQATATAKVDTITHTIASITVTNPGSGYDATATATIDPPPATCTGTCTPAVITPLVTPPGVVTGIVLTSKGTGWTANPTVTIAPPTCSPASATCATAMGTASINSEVQMIDAVPHTATSTLPLCTTDNPLGGANQVMGLLDASGNPINGTGLPAACYPSSWPTDGRDGGVPDPTTAGPPFIQIGNESGLLPHPVVIPSTPVGYEYNRKSITVLNVFNHGLFLGPAERADVVVDFSKYAGQTLIVYNDAPAPVPAFDPRNDYYTGDPDNTSSGGAPTTLPGYGPNTRTVMQIKVNATSATADTFSLSTLTAALPAIYATSQKPAIVPEPANTPGVTATTYSRIQDTNFTGWFGVPIAALTLTNPGSGYALAPNVNITGGGGTGATATASFTGGNITGFSQLVGGAGYSSAPTVVIDPPAAGGTQATATALFSGGVGSVTVNTGGSGYRSMPTISFTGGGGTGAAATASGAVNTIAVSNGGSGYNTAPVVNIAAPPAGGTQATATATITNRRVTSITVTNPGSGYLTNPAVSFTNTGTGGSGASATSRLRVDAITVTAAGANYITPPTVVFNNGGTGGSGATATAVLSGSVSSLLLTNGGSGYAVAPNVSFTGGGAPTIPASATAVFVPGVITGITLTNPGSGFTSQPTVAIDPPPAGGTQALATATPSAIQFKPKAIQELFTLDYGRMNATLGVELPFTNFFTQTTIPYGYVDPPTELYKDGEVQIWKITHNGVDTHFIHFHLFDVQVINRVGWDGMIKPPDDNEVSWKDTVRMNPLEDIIVALKPMKQVLPWELPNSVRPLDVTESIGASNANNAPGFANIDTGNNPVTVVNDMTNFGYEYVWHCHILAHEEIDMMRPAALAVAPDAPLNVTAVRSGSGNSQSVLVSWTDASMNESGFSVQRATNLNGPWLTLSTPPAVSGSVTAMSFTDTTMARRTTYYYRVVANNLVGYTRSFPAPAVGYPTLSNDSVAINAIAPITTLALNQDQHIFADSFETGLGQWSGKVGDLAAVKNGVIGPYGGDNNLAAKIDGGKPAYLFDLSPKGETTYDANFYFNPNNADAGGGPVDIFLALDQIGQPAFGVQYQSLGVDSFQLRSWLMQNGDRVYSAWDAFTTDEPEDHVNATHKIEVAFQSAVVGGLSLYIDDVHFSSLVSDTSAVQLSEALLGPSMGLSAASTGTMFFDEFTSSRINGLQNNLVFFLPLIGR